MAIFGELNGLGDASHFCEPLFGNEPSAQRTTKLAVCTSAAGAYLGHYCHLCGPISRETGYMSIADAENALRALSDPTGQTPKPQSVTLR
jgi:hypothetical protein